MVALYFAVCDYKSDTDAGVWIMNPWSLNSDVLGAQTVPTYLHDKFIPYFLNDPNQGQREVTADLPVALRPIRNTERIVAQKGMFTIHGKNQTSL